MQKNWSHPFIRFAHGKITFWDWSHDTEYQLKQRWKGLYAEAVAEFREIEENGQILSYSPETSIEPPPFVQKLEQLPTPGESVDIETGEVIRTETANKTVWDRSKVERGSRKFDEEYFKAYRKYLLTMPESVSFGCSVDERYDRMRLLCQQEGEAIARYHDARNIPQPEIKPNKYSRRGNTSARDHMNVY